MNNELVKLREKWEASVTALELRARGVSGGAMFLQGELDGLRGEVSALKMELSDVIKERDCAKSTIERQSRELESNRKELDTMATGLLQKARHAVEAAQASAQGLAAHRERADSVAEELHFMKAENEALRLRVENSDNVAAAAQKEIEAREQFTDDVLKRLGRAESECERISQNFVQYRMEIITRNHRDDHRRRRSEPVLGEKLLSWLSNRPSPLEGEKIY
jgi:chromosome segregation ATPase